MNSSSPTEPDRHGASIDEKSLGSPEQGQIVLDRIWQDLTRASHDAKHDWHWPSLASIGKTAQGLTAHSRVVVLRTSNKTQAQLQIHSDSRAQKLPQLTEHPNASMLFYNRKNRTQLRVRCSAHICINNAQADAAWQSLPEHGRTQYLGNATPGNLTTASAPSASSDENIKHFALILLNIESMDWLQLAREGHERWSFTLDPQSKVWHCQSLVP